MEIKLHSFKLINDSQQPVSSINFRLAGLECEKISGQAKGGGYYPGCFDPDRLSRGPGAHAWNAVKLGGKWYLSDATWAAGSVGKPY